MSDRYIDTPEQHMSPDQQYAAFDHYQTQLADALTEGIFTSDPKEMTRSFRIARQYTTDTSRRTYIEPEEQTPVIDYVAGRIETTFSAHVEDAAQSPADLLALCRRTYEQFRSLASYEGYGASGDDLVRTYFPMRDLYRRGVITAQNLGDEDAVMQWQKDWLWYSHGPEKEMRPYDPEYQERTDLYDRFTLNKQDDEIWREVVHKAQHEDDRGEAPRHQLQDISTEELSDLADLLRSQTKDEQYSTLVRQATNGQDWNKLLVELGDVPLTRTLKRFLDAVVSKEELETLEKTRLPHAVILGGRDVKAIDQMVFSQNRPAKGGHIPATPIADNITIIEPSEVVRATDEKVLADETHVKLIDGLPTDMPFENASQQLIVGARNTEHMDGCTLSDFYLELARVLQRGGTYIESNRARSINDESFSRWKTLLAQMIVDTVEDRGTIPDRMSRDTEVAMLKGLGLTEQIFKFEGREIRALVKDGAVKEVGWYAMKGRGGAGRLFGIEIGGEPDVPRFTRQKQTTRDTVVW